MNTQNNGKRFESYKDWDISHNFEYDYARNGVVKKIVSKPMAQTDNPILKIILQFYDSTITYMLKSIDILKNFKNIHWKNR